MRQLSILCVVALCGCGKAPPTLSAGKPISYWVQAAGDRDAKVRKQAVTKLGNVGGSDPAVVPALVAALKDADAGVRCQAILALVKCGPDAKGAIEALVQVRSRDRDPKAREYAAEALKKIDGDFQK